jgi:hypothetical protein
MRLLLPSENNEGVIAVEIAEASYDTKTGGFLARDMDGGTLTIAGVPEADCNEICRELAEVGYYSLVGRMEGLKIAREEYDDGPGYQVMTVANIVLLVLCIISLFIRILM